MTRMELTRRDAIAALAATGIAVSGTTMLLDDVDDDGQIGDHEVQTLTAVADVVYPSAVDGVDAFVEQFVRGRAAERPDHAAGIADAVGYLDEYASTFYDREFASLDPDTAREALDRMAVDTADPDPDGVNVERVRYYVINELLFALYASPTGGKLVGLENPQGHPGGTRSYRRRPSR